MRIKHHAGWRNLGLFVVLAASTAVSFGVTRLGRSLVLDTPASTVPAEALRPRSGGHLVAYVILSNKCAACQDDRTKRAVKSLRDSLRSSHAAAFVRVSVVGVDIEGVESGVEYLGSFGTAFDELSVGGAWMNHILTTVVWRNALAPAATPTVVLVRRDVNAHRYPHDIAIDDDSLILSVSGRDSLIRWVNAGTPLVTRGLDSR